MEWLLTNGLLLTFALIALSAIAAWIRPIASARVVSLGVLAVASVIGALTAFFVLITDGTATLSLSPFLFDLVFVLDRLSAVFFGLIAAISAVVSVYSISYFEHAHGHVHVPSVLFLLVLFVGGMLGVTVSQQSVGFMLFWELMSISSFFLVLSERTIAARSAAIQYLIMTQLGAAALIAGFVFLSGGELAASFVELSDRAAQLNPAVLIWPFLLFLFGFGSKAGLVPFHTWLPEAHPQAPSPVSALMSGVMLKVALYGMFRAFTLMPAFSSTAAIIMVALGLLSAVYGVLYAVIDRDIKRTLAFSSIENMGLLFTMLGVGFYAASKELYGLADIAVLACLIHAVNHAVFKSGLFLTAGSVVSELKTRSLEQMGGLARRMPRLSGAFLALALGAAALPPFGAFFGEWTFIQGLMGSFSTPDWSVRFFLVVVLVFFVFSAGLAIFAMVKLFGIATLGAPRSLEAEAAHDPSLWQFGPVALLALMALLLGAGSPALASLLGGKGYVADAGVDAVLSVGFVRLSALGIAAGIVLALLVAWILRRMMSNTKLERSYHTWDCGQPIDATMEYTATAFSSSIRFFFRVLLRTKKMIVATPVVETNPWIASRRLELNLRSIWWDYAYAPIGRGILWLAVKARRVQSGVVQWYAALIFLALVVTLLIAL